MKHGDRWSTGTHTNRNDVNNNPPQTWGRTDYIKGDITGNTWDTIKTQTKTNQLMMGNRKDHIRVRRQRQRKTKSDIESEMSKK